MAVSTAGLIGAAAGLLCALVTYLTVMAHLNRTEAGATSTVSGEGRPDTSIIRMVLLADFVVLAAVGYYVGQMLG